MHKFQCYLVRQQEFSLQGLLRSYTGQCLGFDGALDWILFDQILDISAETSVVCQ